MFWWIHEGQKMGWGKPGEGGGGGWGGGMWRRKGVEDSRKTLEEAVTPI